MDFRTTIKAERLLAFDYDQRYMMMGSCFAEHIGSKLNYYGFSGTLNPFGVLYNPYSISHALRRIMSQQRYSGEDLFHHQGLYGSFDFHGSYSQSGLDCTLEGMNRSLKAAYETLLHCSTLFITWGSAWVYERDGNIVGNCHKYPEKVFTTRRLTIDEIVTDYRALLNELRSLNPHLKVVFTVSPIRYLKYGAIENQRNKALLHLAIDALSTSDDGIGYFPAYELLQDDLRDYRFYAEDMIHPSPQAIAYIWEAFVGSCISPQARETMKQIESIRRRKAHRPLHPDSTTYAIFVETLEQDINTLISLHPNIQL